VDPQLLELALVFERECHFSHHFHPEGGGEAIASTLTSDPMEDVAIVARAMNTFLAVRLDE